MNENNNEFNNFKINDISKEDDKPFDYIGFSVSPDTEDAGNTPTAEQRKAPVAKSNTASKKRKKSSGTAKSLVWVLCIVVIALGIAFGVIYAGADYLGLGFGRGKNCVVDIPEGSPTVTIAEKLQESGAVKIPMLFRLYSKFKHYDGMYKYGVYRFNNELGYEGIAEMLMTKGAIANTKIVTIPEMSTIDDMAKILEEKGICDRSDFIDVVQNGNFDYDFIKEIPAQSVYYRFEGYLFPDTYEFYVCEDSREGAYLAVELMLSTFNQKTDGLINKINDSKYSFHEIITMASLVELEAGGSPDEMSNVAAIFYNRLESDEFTTLGSSPTIKYPHGNGRYNTYKCIGLPPGPLCAPSYNSIKAAVEPAEDMDCYYFVTDKKMNFYYRKTLSEHNAIIAKLQAENNWIYESYEE